jgi:hypothetical protein
MVQQISYPQRLNVHVRIAVRSKVSRFGVSLEDALLRYFDRSLADLPLVKFNPSAAPPAPCYNRAVRPAFPIWSERWR